MESNTEQVLKYLSSRRDDAEYFELCEREMFMKLDLSHHIKIFEESGFIYISNGIICYIISPQIITNEHGYTKYSHITEGIISKSGDFIPSAFIDIAQKSCDYESFIREIIKIKGNKYIVKSKKRMITYLGEKYTDVGNEEIEIKENERFNRGRCLSMKRNG